MNNVKAIRDRLGLTQAALAQGLGCTQGNVWHYEQGQTVPPDAARRLIDYAATLGHTITFNDIYGEETMEVATTDASELVRHAGDPLTKDPALAAELIKAEQAGIVKLTKQPAPWVKEERRIAREQRRAIDRAKDAELEALKAAGKGA